ncbi:MAG: acyl carrier protein [Limisphaerales bacterium]|jgi:acyl carrier protein
MMKDMHSILKSIRPESDFAQSADFIADGLLDSFDILMLVSTIEKTYGLCIPGTDIVPENFQNLQTIEALMSRSEAKV